MGEQGNLEASRATKLLMAISEDVVPKTIHVDYPTLPRATVLGRRFTDLQVIVRFRYRTSRTPLSLDLSFVIHGYSV